MRAILLNKENIKKIVEESPVPGKDHLLHLLEAYKYLGYTWYFSPDDGRYPKNSWIVLSDKLHMKYWQYDEEKIKTEFVELTPKGI